jgi:hypothetical protein
LCCQGTQAKEDRKYLQQAKETSESKRSAERGVTRLRFITVDFSLIWLSKNSTVKGSIACSGARGDFQSFTAVHVNLSLLYDVFLVIVKSM